MRTDRPSTPPIARHGQAESATRRRPEAGGPNDGRVQCRGRDVRGGCVPYVAHQPRLNHRTTAAASSIQPQPPTDHADGVGPGARCHPAAHRPKKAGREDGHDFWAATAGGGSHACCELGIGLGALVWLHTWPICAAAQVPVCLVEDSSGSGWGIAWPTARRRGGGNNDAADSGTRTSGEGVAQGGEGWSGYIHTYAGNWKRRGGMNDGITAPNHTFDLIYTPYG